MMFRVSSSQTNRIQKSQNIVFANPQESVYPKYPTKPEHLCMHT